MYLVPSIHAKPFMLKPCQWMLMPSNRDGQASSGMLLFTVICVMTPMTPTRRKHGALCDQVLYAVCGHNQAW